MRVGLDVTVSARAVTGVGVYARQLHGALLTRRMTVERLEAPLGPPGSGLARLVSGARLMAWESYGLASASRRAGVDLVHATTAVGPIALRAPLVMSVHDATTVTMPVHASLADRAFQHLFCVRAARRADAILAPSEAAASAISEHFRVPRGRIRVVPLGVDERFRQAGSEDAARASARYGLLRPYVLYVGADTPRKNLALLTRAMGLVRQQYPDVELIWAGPSIQPTPRRGHDLPRPGVRHLGVVPDALLPGLYAGARCLAYVSRQEGFGLPVLEAMAAGTPVVTSDCSALPEVAGGAALLVDPERDEAVAEGLLRVLSESGLVQRLSLAGRARSATFNWNRTAALTEEVYRAVLGQTSTSPTPIDLEPASGPVAGRIL